MDEDRRPYRKKLLDPRWQRVRLRVFERDGWACVACGETTRTLHVHHLAYRAGQAPWEAHPDTLATLCALCHGLVSPAAAESVMDEWRLSQVELWELADEVEERLTYWAAGRRQRTQPPPDRSSRPPASSCPDWRALRPRAGRVWTPDEDEVLLLEFDAGLPLAEIAARRGRGEFAVEVRLCKLGRGGQLDERRLAERGT